MLTVRAHLKFKLKSIKTATTRIQQVSSLLTPSWTISISRSRSSTMKWSTLAFKKTILVVQMMTKLSDGL